MKFLVWLAQVVFGVLLPLMGVVCLVALGVWGVRQGLGQAVDAPLTPLAEASAHVGQMVRLQGQAAEGSDPVTTAGGEKLAAERVRVTTPEVRTVARMMGRVNVDYDMVTPGALAITDGKTTLDVQSADIDLDCWPPRAQGTLQNGMPDAIKALLADRLPDPPLPTNGKIEVWTLPLGAPIVVYGKVEQAEKKVVIACDFKQSYIVSPLSFEDATTQAQRGKRRVVGAGIAALLAAAALFGTWAVLVRRAASSRSLT